MRRKRFGLLGRFAALSAVLITAVGLLLGAALHRSIQDRAVANAIDRGEVAAVGIGSLVRPDDLERNFVPLGPERVDVLDDAFRDVLADSGIVRLKLWNRQHWLVYSDNEDSRRALVPEHGPVGQQLRRQRRLGVHRFRRRRGAGGR